MLHEVGIYLSSTTFNKDNDPIEDVEWKQNLKKEFDSLLGDKYIFNGHDPLKVLSDKAEIVIDDISHIVASHFIVCYLPKTKLTIGTIMELQYSLINKPKDCFILIDRYKIHRNHPWIKYWVKHIVDNERDAVTKIMNILGNSNFKLFKEGF